MPDSAIEALLKGPHTVESGAVRREIVGRIAWRVGKGHRRRHGRCKCCRASQDRVSLSSLPKPGPRIAVGLLFSDDRRQVVGSFLELDDVAKLVS